VLVHGLDFSEPRQKHQHPFSGSAPAHFEHQPRSQTHHCIRHGCLFIIVFATFFVFSAFFSL
jgi:hypothetical protein